MYKSKYQDDLVLSNNSIIHCSRPRRVIKNNRQVQITCGSCNKTRWVNAGRILSYKIGKATGLCSKCFMKLRAGSNHHLWKGGRTLSKEGYIYVHSSLLTEPDMLLAQSMLIHTSYVLEHRLVMAQVLGRSLTKDEHVHHLNGIVDDNRSCNLMLVSPGSHPAENRKVFEQVRQEVLRLQNLLDEHGILY